jgi:hypothetical protein
VLPAALICCLLLQSIPAAIHLLPPAAILPYHAIHLLPLAAILAIWYWLLPVLPRPSCCYLFAAFCFDICFTVSVICLLLPLFSFCCLHPVLAAFQCCLYQAAAIYSLLSALTFASRYLLFAIAVI